jgi:hypothetical protein
MREVHVTGGGKMRAGGEFLLMLIKFRPCSSAWSLVAICQ